MIFPGYLCLMNDHEIFRLNSKYLKKAFAPFNPIFGDSSDPYRFLLNVKGIKKCWIPKAMCKIPLIDSLIKHKSLSAFLRSDFRNQNSLSSSIIFRSLLHWRLKYDFPFWLYYHFPELCCNLRPLLNFFHEISLSLLKNKPIRFIIRKNFKQNFSTILTLFTIWTTIRHDSRNNIMIVAPSTAITHTKSSLISLSTTPSRSIGKTLSFLKEGLNLFMPVFNSKIYFSKISNPDGTRGFAFSSLLVSDFGLCFDSENKPASKIIAAAFPVIPNSVDSVILLETGPTKKDHFINKEINHARKGLSPFSLIELPWFHDSNFIFEFDFPNEKLDLYHKIIKFKNKEKFPGFPFVDGRYIFSLWRKGVPLEALYWYLTESSFYPSKTKFINRFPPVS